MAKSRNLASNSGPISSHRYTQANTFMDRRGKRRCRTCQRDSEARRVRHYSYRRTAICSVCGEPRYVSSVVSAALAQRGWWSA